MNHSKAMLVALTLVCFVAASADATPPKAEVITASYAQIHHCGWVGPGGRAVYRCNLDSPSALSIAVAQNHTLHRVCDWTGPGGRAVYMCRYQ
jgi:hypothetical protein